MYQAIKVIQTRSTPCYLIRYSRFCPELLTISYRDEKLSLGHTRKPITTSIPDLLKQEKIPDIPLPGLFNWKSAVKNSKSISAYVLEQGSYYTPCK